MRRELSFLKGSNYTLGFRENYGHDLEFDLEDCDLSSLPTNSGVYVIASSDGTKFIYPNGKSPIIYIGKAINLKQRLSTHFRHLQDLRDNEENYLKKCEQDLKRYHYMKAFGAKVFLFKCRGRQDAKELESEVINKFYQRYRSLPVGNGARSFSLKK